MGRVVFIGAGPGAADLITLRGARFLAQADVVLFDALTDPALRELAPSAQWVDVGKRGFAHATRQTAINALLVRSARRHGCVVRLKGGDPSLFGRLEEEIAALAQHGIDFEVVPGVTAALAAAAHTARPLTRRGHGRSVSLTTAMTQLGVLQAQTRRLNIVAPAAGLVLERKVEPGQVVGPGSGVLFRMAKGGEMEMKALLGEVDLAKISQGISARSQRQAVNMLPATRTMCRPETEIRCARPEACMARQVGWSMPARTPPSTSAAP